MPVTNFRGQQITDGTIQRNDLDVATAGSAVVRRLIAGTNVTFTSTGADSGTGDITINAASGGGSNIPTKTTTWQVAASSDDTSSVGGGFTDITSPTVVIASQFGQVANGGFRFTGINIPQGAIITSCTFEPFMLGDSNTETIVYAAQDTDNAPTFVDASAEINSRVRTAQTTSRTGTNTIGRVSVDVRSAVQAVVARAGWVSGNALVILGRNTTSSSSNAEIRSFNGNAIDSAKLIVVWQLPAVLTRVITVSPVGQGGQYNTITAAINFIVANRTLATDYYVIEFTGVFTETVTLPGNIALVGSSIVASRIIGTVNITTTTTTDLNELQNFKITHDNTADYPIRLGGAGVIIGSNVFIDMPNNSSANSFIYIDRTNKLSPIRLDDFTGNYDNTSLSGSLNFIDAAATANFPIDFRMNNAMFIFAAGPNASVGFIRVAGPTNTDGRAFFTNPVYNIRSSSTTRAVWSKLFISQVIEVHYVNQEVIARLFNLYPSMNGLSSAPDDKNRISGTTPVFPNSRYFVNNEITEGTVFYAEKTIGDFGLYVRKPLAADFRIDVAAVAGATNTASGVLDFGTDLQTDITTTISAAWITTASIITVVLRNSATVTDHSVEDGAIEGVSVYVVSQTVGSCVVQANSPSGSIGRYNFALIGI